MNIKKLAIPIVIVLVLVIAGISVASYFGSVIDLSEYIEIEGVTGLNGQGVLQYRLKGDLADELFGEMNEEEVTDENYEAIMAENFAKYDEVDYVIECITLAADKERGLSNGDTVTVTASFRNTDKRKIQYRFKEGSQTYTVSGLTEGKTVDPFAEEAVTVTFSGLGGEGEAVLTILSQEEPYSLFFYQLSNSHYLNNGDTVTLTATVNERTLEQKGYFIPEMMEKTYTVSGLAEYFNFSNGFPSAELSSLCDQALSASKQMESEEIADGYMITAPSKIHKVYAMKVNDPAYPHSDYAYNVQLNNAICIVTSYYIEGTGFFPLSREEWTVWVYPNYYTSPDGTIAYEEAKAFDMSLLGENVEEIEAWLLGEYIDMSFDEMILP